MRPGMKPYEKLAACIGLQVLGFILVATLSVTAAQAQPERRVAADPSKAAADEAVALTAAGLSDYFNTNYEPAVRAFKRVTELRPEDPGAWNHLLEAELFAQLYRAGALNSTLYANDSFLHARPVQVSAEARNRIQQLTEHALKLSDARLQKDANDVDALYYRGVTRGLRATYQGLVEHAWIGALRSAIGARHDHERALELKPGFTDAKTVLGVHNYVAGSLPWAIKGAISVVGLSGSKEKGLQYLREVSAANVETTPDAKVALALFLRREKNYPEAHGLIQSLALAYPHNFLFALEQANLLKEWGKAEQAMDAFRKLLAQPGAFYQPQLEFADLGLAELLRARGRYQEAAEHYQSAVDRSSSSPDVKQRAALAAGEMYDVLQRRDLALKQYEVAIASDSSSPLAAEARHHLKEPYRAQ